jgi:protein TonB
MFDLPKRRYTRRNSALFASFLLHCALIYSLVHRTPAFVKPSTVAWGLNGQSEKLIYFSSSDLDSPREKIQLHLRTKPQKPKPAARPTPPEAARSGLAGGSVLNGSAFGSEAMPAIPLVFPDPAVFPWQLRNGLTGDVVVEVTIDERGKVTQTRLLQSLQQDIDDKVVATVREWRFRPATVDGMAISSRQDVHFHFPS